MQGSRRQKSLCRCARCGARLSRLFSCAIFPRSRTNSSRSLGFNGASIRSWARSAKSWTARKVARPSAVMSLSFARRSSSDARVRHKAAVLQILDDDRDRRSIQRRDAADRRLVEGPVRRQRGQGHILRRREVKGLTLVEKDRDRDLVTSAQEMPRHFQQFLDRVWSWQFQNFRQEAPPEDCQPTVGSPACILPGAIEPLAGARRRATDTHMYAYVKAA